MLLSLCRVLHTGLAWTAPHRAVPLRQGQSPMLRKTCLACLLVVLSACDSGSEDQRLAAAQQRLDKKDLGGAVIELKNVLSKNPDSAQARYWLGRVLLQGGDVKGALQELRKAQELDAPQDQVLPEIARAMLANGESALLIAQHRATVLGSAAAAADLKTSLATAYTVQGDLDQARQTAALALQAQPGQPLASVLLARLDASQGKLDEALLALDDVLVRHKGHLAAGLARGEILLRAKNQPDAALATWRETRDANPESVDAHLAVLDILMQQDPRGPVKAELAQLQKLAPRHPQTLLLQAQLAFDDKDFKASSDITQQLLAVLPNNVRVLVLAGAAELQLRRYALAQGLLSRAVKLAPDLLLARHLLAQAYLRDAMPDKAIDLLSPVTDSPQADAASLALLGEASLRLGDSARAEAAFLRAQKAAPDDGRLRTSLALAQLARGDIMPATAQLEALAASERGTHADLALISVRLQQGDGAAALRAIDALAKKLPDDSFVPVMRGRLLFTQGNLAGAAASFEQALAKQPNSLPALDGLASIDISTGRPEQARQRYRALIKAEPKQVRARLALAALEARLDAPPPVVVALLKEAIQSDPTQAASHLALIERLLVDGDGPAAQAAAQQGVAALPNDLALMDALGRAQLANGDTQQALSSFTKLVALQPKRALPLLRLADVHIAAKDPAAATRALRRALDIEANSLPAQRGLALLALMNKQAPQGLAIARALQQRQPKDAAGFALEGELQSTLKDWSAAASAYAAALRRGPSTELAIELHRSQRAAGKSDAALRTATDWQQAHPSDAVFAYYLGDSAAMAKDWARAEAHYRAVLAVRPRHALAMNNIAWMLAAQRKPGALAMAEHANALMPERATLLDTLALAQESENQLPQAVATQRRAVALAPKDAMLRLRLAHLLIKQGEKSDARKELESLARLGDQFGGQADVSALLKKL